MTEQYRHQHLRHYIPLRLLPIRLAVSVAPDSAAAELSVLLPALVVYLRRAASTVMMVRRPKLVTTKTRGGIRKLQQLQLPQQYQAQHKTRCVVKVSLGSTITVTIAMAMLRAGICPVSAPRRLGLLLSVLILLLLLLTLQ